MTSHLKDTFSPGGGKPHQTIAVLAMPGFNMLATTAFLDPFRAMNYLQRQHRYDWHIVSPEGGDVTASNGMAMTGTEAVSNHMSDVDMIVVSASWTPEAFASPPVLAWLRRQERRGAMIGGIDTGAFVLAYGGLLGGHLAAVHFEHHASFLEIFSSEKLSQEAFSLDHNRFSSAGGTAATDLALALLSRLDGPAAAREAARYLYHHSFADRPEMMPPQEANTAALQTTGGQSLPPHLPQKLEDVIRMMEDHLENVLAIEVFAARVRLSQRQLERYFKAHLNTTPVKYYLQRRLNHARSMVTQTSLPMIEVAMASGFTSQEHFSRSYRKAFGVAPSADRQISRVPFQMRR